MLSRFNRIVTTRQRDNRVEDALRPNDVTTFLIIIIIQQHIRNIGDHSLMRINKYKYINLTRLKFFNIYWKTKSSAPNKPQRSGRRWKPLVVLVVVVLEVLPGVVMPGPSRGDAGRTNQGEVGPSSGENYHVVYDDDCASEDDVDNYHYMNYC